MSASEVQQSAELVRVCPSCERPLPRFVPGEQGPFCTPMTCDEWTLKPLGSDDA